MRRSSRVNSALTLLAAIPLLYALSIAAFAQTAAPASPPALVANWTQQFPANAPSARGGQAMAYDSLHQQVVLFGGGGSYSDTWLWNGGNWTQPSPANSPSPRLSAAMAYDTATGQVVMFGGLIPNSNSIRLGDTWLWDGTNWTQAPAQANGPGARDGQAMVYDPVHNQVVMFGGIDGNGSLLNETWLWNGSSWTQANTTSSPSPRSSSALAYDAATGQVLLFGGAYGNSYYNETWVWDGTNWTQQQPQNSPSARYSMAMDYDSALGQIVMFGGYNGNYLNDTWLWSGTNWVQSVPPVNPSPRYFTQDMVYDAARGQMLLFGGFNFSNSPTVFNDTWEFGLPGNFGKVNVCPVGQVYPNGCGSTITFTYNLATTTTFGATQVLTQGTPNLDFTLAPGGTCTGTVSGGAPLGSGGTVPLGTGLCTVNVNFAPRAAGLRTGAINLVDGGGNLLATTPISGVGQGPAAAIGPGTQSAVNTGNYTLSGPRGVAVDASGTMFISDTGHGQVIRVGANGSSSTVGSSLSYPQGIAEDGAGNLYIADNVRNQIVEVPAGCTSSSCQLILGSNLRSQLGVAVDGASNVYVGDFLDGEVVESPAGCTTTACQKVVYGPGGNSQPVGLTVDGAGDLFLADFGLKQVVEVPAGCGVNSCHVLVGSGWNEPEAVAVDAAGDIFVADLGLAEVVEIPAGCTTASCQTVVKSGVSVYGLGLDAQGDILIPDYANNQVLIVNRSQAPTLTFAATSPGTTSSDSPQSVTLQNIGNQPLIAQSPTLLTFGDPSFASVPGSGTPVDCLNDSVLAPGGACNLSVRFTPQSSGTFGSTAVFHDNAPSYAQGTQVINLMGTGVAANFPLSVALIGSGTGTVFDSFQLIACSEANGLMTGSCSANYSGGAQVTLTANATGTSKFLGWGGVCANAGTNSTCSVTLNQAANATASFVNESFGGVNVCPVGLVTQLICSKNMPVTFNLATTTTVGALKVVTQGVAGLDFSLGSGSTCTGTVTGGSACTVNVNFTPIAPGLRMGAVQLYDNNANLVASTPIYGVGQEPEIAFGPGTQAVVNTTANYPLSTPKGVAVDALGDLFISDTTKQEVVKIAANGTVGTVGVGLAYPQGLAVDGAGNVYIADNNLNQVVEVPAGCTSSSCQLSVGSGLRSQQGVAVDGPGDVFISDSLDHEVVEVAANGGTQTVVYSAGTNANPAGLATDAAGDLFIADYGLAQVVEIPAGCVSSNCAIQVGSGWSLPQGVAVDAAGDVFVADLGLSAVVEVPAACTSSACQITVAGGVAPYQIAVDAKGTVLLPNPFAGQVVGVVRSLIPFFSFASTNVGSTSTDSPRSLTVQNIGNVALTGSVALSLGGSFAQTLTRDCASSLPLAPGALCGESFSFIPQSATFLAGSAVFTDNNLNGATPAPQVIGLSGTGAINGVPGLVSVPNVIGQAQSAAATPINGAGLAMGTVTTAASSTVPAGSIIDQNPEPGTQVNTGFAVSLLVSTGSAQPAVPNPLLLENNYFVTGDYVSAGVTLRGTGVGGIATGNIVIPSYAQSPAGGVPDGADIVDAFLYWETVESTPTASSANATFNHYSIVGQQIGNDVSNYTDGTLTGTIRMYRAAVNAYLPDGANGVRFATGTYTVTLPDGGGSALPLTEGASLVLIYRVLSPNFPLKSVVLYDGAVVPAAATAQVVKGFYDAAGGGNSTGKSTALFASNGAWNTSVNTVSVGQPSQYSAPLNPGSAYAAVILSTPVNNSDNDGILDAWKTGPGAGDFHAGQPGYYDTKTATWVGLPGAKHGQKDLFVQMDYMCGALLANGACDPAQENLFPSPDGNGNDPLAMVKAAFAASGVQLHLTIGNAIAESTCVDDLTTNPATLCQFPGQPGVIGWKNGLEFSKLFPRNFLACITGGDCTTRFPYGQKDSYHYVLFGHSLAIPAWNSRYGSLVSINVANGVTTIVTTDRGTGINKCPSRITLTGVIGDPSLNGVYDTLSCADTKTITVLTPGVPNFIYPNSTLPEPVIGLTSGTITSISGYSDLGGSDSAVSLGLWLTAPNQDMSKKANVVAGTLFHEIGHTLGLSHGGLYYDTPSSYLPTFEGNCKPNYQSVMNYLFQLDLVGQNHALAFSNQVLNTIDETKAGSGTTLTDLFGNPATYPSTAWYAPLPSGSTISAARSHCDGTPLIGDSSYRVDATILPITPPWMSPQDLSFTGMLQTSERGFNDLTSMDLRQIGATGGEFASLVTVLSFGSSAAPLNITAGGNVALGSGGTIALGSGGNVTLGSGGNVTLGSGGTITLGSGGNVTLGSGGNVTLGSGGTVTPGSDGNVTLGSGGNVTLGSGGTITLGSGGTITMGSGGNVTLGSGGTITLGSGGSITVPSSGGSYAIGSSGGTITLGSGGNVTLGSGGNVTLGSGGTIALGSGGNVTLGSGGNETQGGGGTVTLGSGGNVTLGSGGNVTLGSGGTIALGSGGNVTLGSGGQATLGAGGTVTLGSGGNVTLGSGGNVTLGSGGTITLGSGGNVTLGSGGNVTLGSGGNITLGSGGTITLGSGGTITLGSGGVVSLGVGGSVTLGSGSTESLGSVPTTTSGGGGQGANELTYETANSVVRPTSLPTETSTPAGVRLTWTAPEFGVVQTYTIYRSANGATSIVIGSVSGVNGNPPATEFTDTNPDLTSATVVYTISTTLVPDPGGSSRQSAPSIPAVLKTDQTIVLGPLPSSVVFGTPTPVTAMAMTGGKANGLQVVFSAAGSCLIGNQSILNNVSTASVNLSATGTCTVTASQPGATNFNAANSVSGTFMVLPKGSSLASQTINFAPLPNVQYGISSFQVSATSSAGLPVSLTASGPCTTSGSVSGIGTCSITASAAGNASYSAASLTQSFTIYPAVLQVVASNLTSVYGQPLPALTYNYIGFVKGDGVSVVSGAPALATTATAASSPATYPITVSTGTLATANYSFLYVTGALTVQPASQSPLILNAASPLVYNQSEPLSVTGGSTAGAVNFNVANGPCTVAGSQLTATSGTGTCQVSATMAGNTNYNAVTSSAISVILGKASQTIVFSVNPPASAAYGSSFTVAATGTGINSHLVLFTSSGACGNLGATYTMTSGTGMCSVIANQAGSSNYAAAPQVTKSVAATLATPTVNFMGAPASAAYHAIFNVSAASNASSAASITSSGSCINTGTAVTITSGSGTCSLTATWAADTNYSGTSAKQSTTATKAAPTVAFTGAPASAVYMTSFTVTATTNASATALISSSGGCTNAGTKVTMTSGTTACSLTANWAADSNYSGATATQSTTAVLAPQTITFSTSPPMSANYGASFVVAASGGLSGNPVTFTSAGVCTNSGANYTMTNSVGNCSVIANQAANSNYAAAATVTKSVAATGPSISASPSSINFGTVYLGSTTTRNITVTNSGTSAATINDPILSLVKGGNSNEFVAVNLCPKSLTAGKSCTMTIGFVAGPFYTAQSATLQILSNAPGSPLPVALSAVVINPVVSLSATSLGFGAVPHGTSSTQNVQLSNTGTTPLTLTSISIAGINATSFVQSNACGSSLAAGSSCMVAVKFTPGATGTFSAALTLVDNARNGTQTVSLSGTGK